MERTIEMASSMTMISDTSSFSSISHTATRIAARSAAAMRSQAGARACAEISESMRRRLSATGDDLDRELRGGHELQ